MGRRWWSACGWFVVWALLFDYTRWSGEPWLWFLLFAMFSAFWVLVGRTFLLLFGRKGHL